MAVTELFEKKLLSKEQAAEKQPQRFCSESLPLDMKVLAEVRGGFMRPQKNREAPSGVSDIICVSDLTSLIPISIELKNTARDAGPPSKHGPHQPFKGQVYLQ